MRSKMTAFEALQAYLTDSMTFGTFKMCLKLSRPVRENVVISTLVINKSRVN